MTLQRACSWILEVFDASLHPAKETHYNLCCLVGFLTRQEILWSGLPDLLAWYR